MNPPLILASTSVYRAKLLARLGHPFTTQSPELNETPFKQKFQGKPLELAKTLAREKALAVARKNPQALCIGSDQVAALGEEFLSKPLTVEKAVAQLMKLQGKTHVLYTAVHLIGPGIDRGHVEITRLTMRPLDFTALKAYVEKDLPLDCAGSYKLEAHGIKLFTLIEGNDHEAIVGLPLLWTQQAFLELGLPFFHQGS